MRLLLIFGSKASPFVGDAIDRLCCFWSPLLFVAGALIIGIKQYFESPIQCFVPEKFTDPWREYAERECLMRGSLYHPLHDPIPPEYRSRQARQINYFQWTPYYLCLQAFLLALPYFIQACLSLKIKIVETLCHLSPGKDCDRQSVARYAALAIRKRQLSDGRCKVNICSYSFIFIYVMFKIIIIWNVLARLMSLSGWLSSAKPFSTLANLREGRESEISETFPRTIMCDFEVRVLGNVHHHTVQRNLLINELNERVFLMLWMWTGLLCVLTITSLLHWILISVIPPIKRKFFSDHLLLPSAKKIEQAELDQFVRNYIGCNGVFLLRTIGESASDMWCADVTGALWEQYRAERDEKLMSTSD